jgi:hypothetical protein
MTLCFCISYWTLTLNRTYLLVVLYRDIYFKSAQKLNLLSSLLGSLAEF